MRRMTVRERESEGEGEGKIGDREPARTVSDRCDSEPPALESYRARAVGR